MVLACRGVSQIPTIEDAIRKAAELESWPEAKILVIFSRICQCARAHTHVCATCALHVRACVRACMHGRKVGDYEVDMEENYKIGTAC